MEKYTQEVIQTVSEFKTAEQWMKFFTHYITQREDIYVEYFLENYSHLFKESKSKNLSKRERECVVALHKEIELIFQLTVLSEKNLISFLDILKKNNIKIYIYLLNRNQPLSKEIISKYIKTDYDNFWDSISSFSEVDIDFVNENLRKFSINSFSINNYPNINKDVYFLFLKDNIRRDSISIDLTLLNDNQLLELCSLCIEEVYPNGLFMKIIIYKKYDTDFLLQILNENNIKYYYKLKVFNSVIYKKFNTYILENLINHGEYDVDINNITQEDKVLLDYLNEYISKKESLLYTETILRNKEISCHFNMNKDKMKKENNTVIDDFYSEIDVVSKKYDKIFNDKINDLNKDISDCSNNIESILKS